MTKLKSAAVATAIWLACVVPLYGCSSAMVDGADAVPDHATMRAGAGLGLPSADLTGIASMRSNAVSGQ